MDTILRMTDPLTGREIENPSSVTDLVTDLEGKFNDCTIQLKGYVNQPPHLYLEWSKARKYEDMVLFAQNLLYDLKEEIDNDSDALVLSYFGDSWFSRSEFSLSAFPELEEKGLEYYISPRNCLKVESTAMLIGYVRFCASHDPEDPISNMEIPLKFFDEVPSLCSRIAEYSCPSNKDEFEQHLVETLVKAYNQSLVRTLE